MDNLWNRFCAVAEGNPGAALICGDETLSFEDLRVSALRCAGWLEARGVRRGDIVALRVAKRPIAYSLLLACLRLGAPYAFLDPRTPAERLSRMLDRLRPALMVVEGPSDGLGRNTCVLPAGVGPEGPDGTSQRAIDPQSEVGPTEPAYIMFTSGSTGEPKGAVIAHRGIFNLMQWARRDVHSGAGERFTQLNPIFFDNSVFDIYAGLFNGSAIVPVETAVVSNPAAWVRSVRSAAATVMFAVPTLYLFLERLGLLTPEALPNVRTFLFGGEGYPVAELRAFLHRFRGRARLVNVYGPTETSCICSSVEVTDEVLDRAEGAFPELGRMHDEFTHAVLDERQKPVAPGESGELWIGGPCVGLGYIGNPEETATRFCQDPAQDRARSIWYRSGDSVRQDAAGRLWFQGRIDNQVKFRGFRIELEEIDFAVQSIPGVRRAAGVKLSDPAGDSLAVAFAADREIDVEAVRLACREKLPSYMEPAHVVQLPELPCNANGKIDRGQIRSILAKRLNSTAA